MTAADRGQEATITEMFAGQVRRTAGARRREGGLAAVVGAGDDEDPLRTFEVEVVAHHRAASGHELGC